MCRILQSPLCWWFWLETVFNNPKAIWNSEPLLFLLIRRLFCSIQNFDSMHISVPLILCQFSIFKFLTCEIIVVGMTDII